MFNELVMPFLDVPINYVVVQNDIVNNNKKISIKIPCKYISCKNTYGGVLIMLLAR